MKKNTAPVKSANSIRTVLLWGLLLIGVGSAIRALEKQATPQPAKVGTATKQQTRAKVTSSPAETVPFVAPKEPESNVGTSTGPSNTPPAALPTDVAVSILSDGSAVAFGDIMLGKVSHTDDARNSRRGQLRADVRDPLFWDRPEIPFAIAPNLPNEGEVKKAMALLESQTLVRLVPRQTERDGLYFEPLDPSLGPICLSYLGRVGGMQPIRLSSKCRSQEILHEILHSLGFIHEHSRPDRDAYLEVVWPNIKAGFLPQFEKAPEAWSLMLQRVSRSSSFDPHSIMMYSPDSFSKFEPPITPEQWTLRSKTGVPIGPHQEGLSERDIQRVRELFE